MAIEFTRQGVRNLNNLGPRAPKRESLHDPPCLPEAEWTHKGRGRYVRYCRVCAKIVDERNDRR